MLYICFINIINMESITKIKIKTLTESFDALHLQDEHMHMLMKDSEFYNDKPGAGSFFCDKSFKKHYAEIMIIAEIRRKETLNIKNLLEVKKGETFGEVFEREMKKYKNDRLIKN